MNNFISGILQMTKPLRAKPFQAPLVSHVLGDWAIKLRKNSEAFIAR
jgi:hypothetical protein